MNYQQFAEQNIVIDAHLDLLMDVEIQRNLGRTRIIIDDYLPKFRAGGVNIVVSSLFIENSYIPECALKKAMIQIGCLIKEIEESDGQIMLIKNHNDIVEALENNRLGILLGFEGIEPLHNDLNLLRVFYELGVRILGICWSRSNPAADGSKFDDFEYTGYGLTEFGVELVKHAQELGMIIDVSHLNEKSFWDVLELVEGPLMASHSNCRSIADTPRNLSDQQIDALIRHDGLICFNANSLLVSFGDKDNANMQGFLKHIKYVYEHWGSEHMGFGFDLIESIANYSLELKAIGDMVYDSFNGHSDIPLILENLHKEGLSLDDLKNLAGANLQRLFKSVLK